jgi:hypothetical protein
MICSVDPESSASGTLATILASGSKSVKKHALSESA